MITAILKYIGIGLLKLLIVLVAFILSPLNYYIRGWLRSTWPNTTWWFLNDAPAYDKNDRDVGDFGRFSEDFKGFFQQNVMRNPAHNLSLLLGPYNTNITNVKGDMNLLSVDWGHYKPGFTFATYKAEGRSYFRMSWIWEFSKTRFWHGQLGMSSNTYVYKMKWGNISDKINYLKNLGL